MENSPNSSSDRSFASPIVSSLAFTSLTPTLDSPLKTLDTPWTKPRRFGENVGFQNKFCEASSPPVTKINSMPSSNTPLHSRSHDQQSVPCSKSVSPAVHDESSVEMRGNRSASLLSPVNFSKLVEGMSLLSLLGPSAASPPPTTQQQQQNSSPYGAPARILSPQAGGPPLAAARCDDDDDTGASPLSSPALSSTCTAPICAPVFTSSPPAQLGTHSPATPTLVTSNQTVSHSMSSHRSPLSRAADTSIGTPVFSTVNATAGKTPAASLSAAQQGSSSTSPLAPSLAVGAPASSVHDEADDSEEEPLPPTLSGVLC